MRGKPKGQYGPTGERHSGIRYVPPKEQKEMDEQWRTIYERQQARIAALEAEHAREIDMLQNSALDQIVMLKAECKALAAERDALAAWECESCGARFAETVKPSKLVGVTYCSSCAERDALRSFLHTRNGELMVERMNLDMLRDDVKRAIALLPADPGAALGVLVAAIHTQSAHQASPAGRSEAIGS